MKEGEPKAKHYPDWEDLVNKKIAKLKREKKEEKEHGWDETENLICSDCKLGRNLE